MTHSSRARPAVAIVGPTGSGKSELALRLAQQVDGEIVSCDSVQVYRYFDIGTAKLGPEERQGIPHHMVSILAPDQVFTAGEYARQARALLADISSRERLPLVVGGTGFYLRALLDGLFPGPKRDSALRERLAGRERRRPGSIHRILQRLDRAASGRIHAHDTPKLIRALEVTMLTRRPLTEHFASGRNALEGFRILKLGLLPPREALYQRLNRRLANMFTSGLIDEVRGILARGYLPECKPFESLGYKQALEFVSGKLSLEAAIGSAQQKTRNYAKRQITWFRREADIAWLHGFGDDPVVEPDALNWVRKFLSE